MNFGKLDIWDKFYLYFKKKSNFTKQICYWSRRHRDFPLAQMVKSLPAILETWVWSLGPEDPLEKEMATHSSILASKIPWMEEPGRRQSIGSQLDMTEWLHFHFSLSSRHKIIVIILLPEGSESTFLSLCLLWRLKIVL